ncbi:MAG: sugar isomerase domain-containing protein [Actinobacteria bacterium]|nr:sugar isomerase domain-containing protein [Actinomycetota bacterium]
MLIARYYKELTNLMQKALEEQKDNIKKAAKRMADSVCKGEVIHAFGMCHSHSLPEDLFYRTGGIIPMNAIMENEVMYNCGFYRCKFFENVSGLAKEIIERYSTKLGEIILIFSPDGIDVASVEMCMEAKKRGLFIISFVNVNYSRKLDSYHKSGKKVYEISDIVINTMGNKEEGLVSLEGVDFKLGLYKNMVTVFLTQSLVLEVENILSKRGKLESAIINPNVDGADNLNIKALEIYKDRIRSY